MSFTPHTLKLLRKQGWLCATVEQQIPRTVFKRDLWGFADVLAVHPTCKDFLLVQVTSRNNISSRLKKAKGAQELQAWLKAGGRFEVHGWEKEGKAWTLKAVAVTLENLDGEVVLKPSRRRRGTFEQLELFTGVSYGKGKNKGKGKGEKAAS